MVVTTGAMHMTVIQLFRRGGTNLNDFHVKVQGLTRQRVIAVNGDFIGVNRSHGNDLDAVIGLGLELHADFNILRKQLTRFDGDQFRIIFAEGVFRLQSHLQCVANRLAL